MPIISQQTPTTASLRKYLSKILVNDTDLDSFCIDYFPEIFRKFSSGMSRDAKLNILISYQDTHAEIIAHFESDERYVSLAEKHKNILVWSTGDPVAPSQPNSRHEKNIVLKIGIGFTALTMFMLVFIHVGLPAIRKIAKPTLVLPKSTGQEAPKLDLDAHVAEKYISETQFRPKLLLIPRGDFLMGSLRSEAGREKDEEIHRVSILREFWVGQTEITQRQYRLVSNEEPGLTRTQTIDGAEKPCQISGIGDNNPVFCVAKIDAVIYCNKLSLLEGLTPCYEINNGNKTVTWRGGFSCNGYRLPTEAEWEYAARSGEQTLYAGSNRIDEVAWYNGNSNRQTHEVGMKMPNKWHLFDMTGNLWEWVWDTYKANYEDIGKVDPVHYDSASEDTVIRGGDWGYPTKRLRLAARFVATSSVIARGVGFRIARSVTARSN